MRYSVCLYVLFLCSIYTSGQSQIDNFISFNTSNGMLKHNSVEAFTRDQMGYVWVGTNFGLYRLDGYQTTSFNFDPNDENSLSSNNIKALCVDSDGDLWVGTIGGGLNKYNREKNHFIRYLPNETNNSISGINISAISEDRNGNIWIGTIGKGLNKFNKKTGTFTFFNLEQHDRFNRINSNVNALFCDQNGDIWVGQNQSEIYRIDGQTNEIQYYGIAQKSEDEISKVGAITGIGQLKNGKLLFTTWLGNLYELNPKIDQYIHLLKTSNFFDNSILSNIVIDKNDNIWISTWNNGLYKIDSRSDQKTHYIRDIKNQHSLSSNAINKLFIDNSQNLWICFLDNGISLLSLKEKMIKTLPLRNNEIEYINAYSIVKDKRNNIWIGSRGQGVWKYNTETKAIKSYLAKETPGLNTNSILTLKICSQGKLLVGTDGQFMSIYDPATDRFRQIKNRNDDWSSAVFGIADNRDYIFAGTWGGGIKKIRKDDYSYTSINFDTKDQFRNTVFDLELVDSILWVSNIGLGLIKYNVINETYTIYSKSELNPNFPIERITDIFVENKNSLWLTTDGAGLFQFIPSTGKIHPTFTRYNIDVPNLHSVVTDNKNNLWIASTSSILHINPNASLIYNFNVNNGLTNNQLNKGAMYFDSEQNRIYTGCVEGVNYFNPDNIIIDSLVNRVIMTQLNIMGNNILHPNKKNISKAIDVADTIHLNYKEKIITIHYSSMDFMPSLKNKYYYSLEGFNKNWEEIPYSKNFVQYTNLYPGKYTLRVKACNSDGIYSHDESTLTIIVHPAFWQTLLFRILVLFFILLLLFFYIQYKYRRLVVAKNELEHKINQRTSEIVKQKEQIEQQNVDLEHANNTKNKFFSMISHDLRNPLTSINQLAELINMQFKTASEEKIQNYFDLLKKAAKSTLDLLDDMLIWASTQTNRITVNKKNYLLDEIFYETLSFCYPLAEKKNIELVIPLHTNFQIHVDKNTILTVLRNLITNAIKFSYSGSKIFIKAEEENQKIIVKIIDQGIGMSEEEINHLFKIESLMSKEGTTGETGTGLGLILCSEFLTLNEGEIWVESQKGKGSTFCFSIPKGR